MSNIPSWAPQCPNHECPLEGLPFPMQPKGTGMCPVSGRPFDYEVDLDEAEMKEAVDKFGNKTKVATWKISGED